MSAETEVPAKKKAAPKKPAEHPPYIEMITDRSRQAIEKYIKANYKVGEVGSHLKIALKGGAVIGKLLHTKGVGASGSFKLSKVVTEKKPKKKQEEARRQEGSEETSGKEGCKETRG